MKVKAFIKLDVDFYNYVSVQVSPTNNFKDNSQSVASKTEEIELEIKMQDGKPVLVSTVHEFVHIPREHNGHNVGYAGPMAK